MLGEVLRNQMNRYHHFTGRENELAQFKTWLCDSEAPFRLFYISGIGGIGKSSLLMEMARMAMDDHARVIALDGSACLKTPTGFIDYLAASFKLAFMDMGENTNTIEALRHAAPQHRILITVDHFEQLKLVERLFINDFLPHLPGVGVTAILASRLPLSEEWRIHPDLDRKIVELALQPFTYQETVTYTKGYGAMKPELIHKINQISGGLPLALALLTDSWLRHEQLSDQDYHLASQKISAKVLRELTDPELQPMIDVLTILQYANQETIAQIIGHPVTREHYLSLLKLSFTRLLPEGIAIHDIARAHLLNDLRLREPERLKSLRAKTAELLYTQLSKADKGERRPIATQLLNLCKDELPLDRLYADFSGAASASPIEYASAQDLPVLYKLLDLWCSYSVDSWQSAPYYKLVAELINEAPESIAVLRNDSGEAIGMFIAVLVHQQTGQILKKYFPAEMSECFSEEELSRSLDHADTYYAVLGAATDQLQNYSQQELVGLLSLDQLSLLGEDSRAILVATNSHLIGFLQQIGFTVRQAKSKDCDTSWAKAFVLELDLRNKRFGDWAISFLLEAPNALSAPVAHAELTEAVVRKMIKLLRTPAELQAYLIHFDTITTVQELRQHLIDVISNDSSILSDEDRMLFKTGVLRYPDNTIAAAEACQMSRATYYRHVQKAISHLTHLLHQEANN
ncbi:ATP-binding protein [Sporolactobacillus sp. STSJ-5]|uniref:ATP-binding protein n=1 Tax=Sporolactobacillus sp. STSJ-5 TaxID=2965076 RepID=UPI0021058AD4|nr:ATP-binding protein [Sporolactobacillus sp. STSJ-5]MCQ2009533.1 ATP-binding protein [Sporolactobacillus sp. STSJ-5]